MAYFRALAKGHYRADIRMKGILKNKTFPSQSLAQVWVDKIEHSIKTIPNLDHAQLLAKLMFPAQVTNSFSLPSLVAVTVGVIKARNSASSSADIGLIIRCLVGVKAR